MVNFLFSSPIDLLIRWLGPPGTGKTTTIAAATSRWDLGKNPAWIIAQSNVAVKNIAEALFKRQIDFKVLVSVEFYHEWYERTSILSRAY